MQNLHREIMIKLQCFTKIWCKMAIIPFKILHQAPQERLIIYTVKTLKFTYKGTLSTIEKYNSQHIQFSGHSFEGLEYQVGLMNQSVGTNEHIYCLSIFKIGFQSIAETFGVFYKLFLLVLKCPPVLVLVFLEDIIYCVKKFLYCTGDIPV